MFRDVATFLLIVGAWFAASRWILPRFGIET